MKILLHICCAPCSIYPVERLCSQNFDVMGFFYNPNIQPYQEFLRRRQTLEGYAQNIDLKVIYQKDYELESWLQQIVFRESKRCRICFYDRLKSTAIFAKHGKFDYFTSTLLYSKFQNHELLKSTGEALGKSYGVPFFYEDFRKGWKQGIEISKSLNMYRQQYCGCIYSEKERFFRKEK
ncbi:Epoxyqueuosine reductase QueH [Candidatus Magnetomoraceae bacterium gMMP-1]